MQSPLMAFDKGSESLDPALRKQIDSNQQCQAALH
jgi:hypothetical protein